MGESGFPINEGQCCPCLPLPLSWPPCSLRKQSLQSHMLCTSLFLPSHKLPSYLGQSPSSSHPFLQREGKLLLIFSSTLGFSPCLCFLQRFGLTTLLQDPTGSGLSPTKLPSICASVYRPEVPINRAFGLINLPEQLTELR